MKTILVIITSLMILVEQCLALALSDAIAAIVNDKIITYQDIDHSISPALETLERQYSNQPQLLEQKRQTLIRDALESLVEEQLILFAFETEGYTLPESIIEDEVQRRIRENYTDRATLTKTLQAQGITFESFKKRIRNEIIVSEMRRLHVSKNLIISPYKIEKYYNDNKDKFKTEDQVKLRMIMLSKKNDPEAIKRLAKEIIAKLDDGVPFAEMASVYSEAPQKANGGDWGWVDKTILRKELADVAFSLKPSQHSDIIETTDEYWILFVEAQKPAGIKPLSEVRAEIEKTLMSEEKARLQKQWIDKLKNKAFVRYF
jgi:parvulin-like peptidyl-prolyl isomerase